jgi:lysophospholipase L1-like esterase
MRTTRRFDDLIELDVAVADPEIPTQLLPSYDSGDHLHLSVAGYQAMADAIDLTLFLP